MNCHFRQVLCHSGWSMAFWALKAACLHWKHSCFRQYYLAVPSLSSQLLAAATPAVVLVSSIAAINARHILYSTSMLPYLRHLPLRWRVVLAYLLTDEAYAVTIRRYIDKPHNQYMHYHLLGSGLLLFTVWQISTLAGIMLGTTFPKALSLGFAIPLSFMAIVIPLPENYTPNCCRANRRCDCAYLPVTSME